jgi:hypothetical protein
MWRRILIGFIVMGAMVMGDIVIMDVTVTGDLVGALVTAQQPAFLAGVW